jgi:hypothetical protein
MMNIIVNLERDQQQVPRVPYKGQFQKGTQVFRPKNDEEVPNTLAPANMVDENPWCLQYKDSHWENECPLNNGEHDQVNIVKHTIEGPQYFLNVTLEEHQEGIKEVVRKARMEVINKLDQESRENLKKQEFQVYTRKKQMNQPLSTGPVISQTRPPPMNILLPKNPPKNDKVDLDFDFEGALAKMHITIQLREVIKVPSVKERFDFFFKVLDEPMDLPIILQAYNFRVQYDGHPPLFMTLFINNKCLNNCMVDSGVGANMMSLKVMEKSGLKSIQPYMNVCNFESRSIPTHGVVENVEVCLGRYPERVIHMDIVVVDVPDVWGMLLSRKFFAMLGGTLEMDLTYINMPKNDRTISRLQNVSMAKVHVQEIDDRTSETHEPIKESLPVFSLEDLAFTSEEDFDKIQWPKREEYQQILEKYKDKEVRTIKLLKKGDDNILIKLTQQEVFTSESHPPPSKQYTRVVQETTEFRTKYYQEGDTV